MKSLDKASPKELAVALKSAQDALEKVPRGSKNWNIITNRIKQIKAEISKVNAEMKVAETRSQRFINAFNKWSTFLMTGAAGLFGIFATVKSTVSKYAELEEEMYKVKKYSGLAFEQVQKLNEEFKRFNTRTSIEQLNKFAQDAGKLGMKIEKDILGYVKAADILTVGLQDLGEEAPLLISKITSAYGENKLHGSEVAMLKVGSTIKDLSESCSASAPYLTNFISRVAGVGSSAGMTIPQLAAMGAVLDANNQKVESSATAVSQVLVRMYKDPAKYAASLNLDVEKFVTLLRENPNEGYLQFLDAIGKVGNMGALAPMFKEMGENGARAVSALTTLANHIDDVRAKQDIANKAYEKGNSVLEAFNIMNNTTQAKLDKLKKRFHEVVVVLGEKLLPIARYCKSAGVITVRVLNEIIKFIGKYKSVLIVLISTITAYVVITKTSIAITKAHNAMIVVSNTITKAYRASMLLLIGTINLLNGNVRRAQLIFAQFNAICAANPYALMVAGLVLLISSLALFAKKQKEARDAIRAQNEEARKNIVKLKEWKKSLTDVDSGAEEYCKNEKTRLQSLYTLATDENRSRQERINAVNELIKIYPNYFSQFTAEEIMLGKAKRAYESLALSILDAAKAKAAYAKVEENQSQIIDLDSQKNELKTQISANRSEISRLNKIKTEGETLDYRGVVVGSTRAASEATKQLNTVMAEQEELAKQYMILDGKIDLLNKANDQLIKKYGLEMFSSSSNDEIPTLSPIGDDGSTSTDKSDPFKEDLEKLKTELAKRSAILATERASGLIDYKEYLYEMADLEDWYLENQLSLYEKYDKDGSEQYYSLMQQRIEKSMQRYKEFKDDKLKETLSGLESTYKSDVDALNSSFYNPDSEIFNNSEALKEGLLQLKVEYLTRKRDMYEKDSEQYKSISAELDKAVEDDKISRQKEMLKKLESFKSEYLKKSLAEQKTIELNALDSLYAKKLLSEEEYQKIKAAIIKKYNDMEVKDKKEQVEKISKIAQGVYSVMNTGLSAYNEFSNASRDLEIAKIEKQYDTEIEKASNNTKKKEKLEKQKEAAIAKVKSKYNDRAMKIEIAQAIAQTAMSAINAYSSAAAVPVIGHILAPIAAGMAVAAGMMQVATIKKQHDAEAIGYAEGGFTKKGKKYEVAGMVHAGEWVASQKLVNSPVTGPIISALENAQRSNSVASLGYSSISPKVSSNAMSMSKALGYSNIRSNGYDAKSLANTIDALNDTLNSPIVAVSSVSGEFGSKKALDDYAKLISNKSPKKRK